MRADDLSFDIEALLSAALTALPELRRKLAGLVEVIESYDRAHGTQLLPTLEAYANADRSVATAADRLGVHRHTVVYRVARAERLLGRSLRNGRQRFILELALIARRRSPG